MSSDFQRQDEPWTVPNCTQAALNAPDERFKAKVAQSVRVLLKTKVSDGESGQKCVRVVQIMISSRHFPGKVAKSV